jgi:hypothetical protein
MSPEISTDSEFAFAGIDQFTDDAAQAAPPQAHAQAAFAADAAGQQASPLGPLEGLVGLWKGHGFNTIWRPHHTGQDRFLELNRTDETLLVTEINGPIPNRGLANPDINMFGVTYLQQINEAGTPNGLHIEPGIWASVPQTTDPNIPPTVVRMASIPHGTVILAQGNAQVLQGGPPHISNNNIFPIFFGQPPFPDFASAAGTFPELDLSIATPFRFKSPGVTQDMVTNPNSVLQQALAQSLQGTHMTGRTFLQISTTHNPIQGGGGTANTAFLATSHTPPGGNANAAHVEATFWIQTIAGTGGQPDKHQLQYTQLVMLDFNDIHWPHVTVGTLEKQ